MEKKELMLGAEQANSAKKKTSESVLRTINEITPVFKVYFVMKNGKKVHFASFYGETLYESGKTQKELETLIEAENAEIYKIISELEEEISAKKLKDVKKELKLEVEPVQFGGFMHKRMSEIEDALACTTVSEALASFDRAYARANKTDKQIIDEEVEQYKKDLEALDISFLR